MVQICACLQKSILFQSAFGKTFQHLLSVAVKKIDFEFRKITIANMKYLLHRVRRIRHWNVQS